VPEDLWAQIRAANLAQEEAGEPAVLDRDTQPPKQKRAPPKKREKKGSAKQRRRGDSGSRAVCLVRGGRNGVGAHASGAGQKRRRRSDDGSVAELYASLHARIPQPSAGTASASGSVADLMSAEFSDKELRLLMKFNGLSINQKRKGSYIEIPKPAKCVALVRLSSFGSRSRTI